jgi:Xaa-Pro aminopeptidase
MVLDPKGTEKFTLYVRPRDRTREIWDGFRHGPEGAVTTFNAHAAYNLDSLEDVLSKKIMGRIVEFKSMPGHPLNHRIEAVIAKYAKAQAPNITETNIHSMRQIKSDAEIQLMRQAAAISSEAHNKLLQSSKKLKNEFQLEGSFLYNCAMSGARDQAYPPIVAGGKNATCLHYHANNQDYSASDLILVDAGCSWENYASDITRSFPAHGKFSEEQRAIYQAVLNAQKACIKAVKPGISMKEIHELACKIITEELVNIDLIPGPAEQAFEEKLYFEFFPHNIGHHLGLDVHDCDALSPEERGRSTEFKLASRMVVTIEPGIYIQADNDKVPESWRGIGIRIEDDVLVTDSGCDVLTKAALKELCDIEK